MKKIIKLTFTVLMLILLFSCATAKHAHIPNMPNMDILKRGDFNDYNLYLRTVAVENLTKSDLSMTNESGDSFSIDKTQWLTTDTYNEIVKSIIKYIEAGLQFDTIINATKTFEPDPETPYFIMDITISPSHTRNRNTLLDIISAYPFLGLLPTVQWGESSVEITLKLYNENMDVVSLCKESVSKDYRIRGYSHFSQKELEDDIRENYEKTLASVIEKLNMESNKIVQDDRNNRRKVLVQAGNKAQLNTLPVLSVLDFNVEGISSQEGIFITEYMSSCLFDTGKFRVIDRYQRDSLLQEISFSQSGCSDESCQLEIGKLLSADKIVVGNVGKIGERAMMTVKILEVETGETVSTSYEIYESLESLLDGCKSVALKLSDMM